MSSFGAATFEEQGSVSARPALKAIGHKIVSAAGVETWQGPSSAASVGSLSIPAQMTESELSAMEAMIGHQATLSWGVGGTSVSGRTMTAVLTSIDSGARLKQGDVVKVTLQFERVS